MGKKRYVVTLVDDSDGIATYRVDDTKYPLVYGNLFESSDVWVTKTDIRCAGCYGPLVAMSASCRHVKAVKRHLKGTPR